MKRVWWLAAFALTALAWVFGYGFQRGRDAGLRELVRLTAGRRFIEPRLTGGFAWAPCEPRFPSGRLLPEARCPQAASEAAGWKSAIRELLSGLEREEGDGRNSGEALHGAALALLIASDDIDDIDRAVLELEAATAKSPRNASWLNDLASAYFVRAHAAERPEDLIRALDTVAKALEIEPDLSEARFNLALILDRLHLDRLAGVSWIRFIEADPTADWSREAAERLDRLHRPPASEVWSRSLAALESAVLTGSSKALRAAVARSPQESREYLFEKLLRFWGEAFRSGDTTRADRNLRVAAAIGQALRETGHDPSTEEIAGFIETAQRQGRPGDLARLASGHVRLGEGLAQFRRLETKPAKVSFQQAAEDLGLAGSPAVLWARCGLARCLAYETRYKDAESVFRQIEAQASRRGFSALAGWARWGTAWSRIRQGHLSEGVSHYRLAEQDFIAAGESENLGAVRNFIGEILSSLGQSAAAWRYRIQAFQDLAGTPNSFRRHTVLLAASAAAIDEGLPHAGLWLQEEDVRIAEETRNAVIATEARGARGRIFFALGRNEEALRDLEDSRQSARLAPDSPPGKKLLADLLWLTGESLRVHDPGKAIGPLTQALAIYNELKAHLGIVQSLLSRYQAYKDSRDFAAARRDLSSALQLIEDAGGAIQDRDLKGSYAETVQAAYDDMIGLQWDAGDREGALNTLEQARSFSASRAAALPRLPEGQVAVAYALLPDRLLGWVFDGGRVSTFEKPVGMAEVASLVTEMTAAIQGGDPRFREISGKLYGLLIPEPLATLTEDQTLFVIPDRALSQVSFAALWNPEKRHFLIQDHPVAIVPGLPSLTPKPQALKAAGGEGSAVLLVGNPAIDRKVLPSLPALPYAADEIAAVRAAFPHALALTGPQATRKNVLDELGRADVFIFIGHSVVNGSHPGRSFLALSPTIDPPDSGILLSDELIEASLERLRLVVLTACSTVGPRMARTSGPSGMAEPFLAAGVPTVVGTLWPLEDRRAGALLESFYQAVARGEPAAVALRQAQLAALGRNPEGPHADWASFEVISSR